MPSFQVVFKAGYEVVAWNKEKAVEKATGTPKNYERRKLHLWQVLVTEKLDGALTQAIQEDAHVSKSDLIREAVRSKLTQMGRTENGREYGHPNEKRGGGAI